MSAALLVVCDDLLFWSRIKAAAVAAGVGVARAREARIPPAEVRRVLVDLQATSLDPFACATAWKAAVPALELVAFASHVDLDAQARAREAGFDRVLARSAFVRELPDLVRIHPGGGAPPPSSPA